MNLPAPQTELDALRRAFRDDFLFYAPRALRIKTKKGEIVPFRLNQAQLYIHQRIEAQKKQTGKVRAIILKGRQQGVSTYTEARFYWRVTHEFGYNAFILTHELEATNNLFKMAKLFHEECPGALKHKTNKDNARNLAFSDLNSEYRVATAGAKGSGRSQTLMLFHGSEVAYWPHAATHAAGALQAVGDVVGTEIFLESTANGIGNYFHSQWQLALSGESDYQALFIPWYWQSEYALPTSKQIKDFAQEDQEYADAYGLSASQLQWREKKILELDDDADYFDQEYPASPAVAFRSSFGKSLISASHVAQARKAQINRKEGARILSVDVARFGDDATVICYRKARQSFIVERLRGADTQAVVGAILRAIAKYEPNRVFVEVVGLSGAGVIDSLTAQGYSHLVREANPSLNAIEKTKYTNRRTEMWCKMRDWLKDGCDIEDDDALEAELCAVQYDYDGNGRIKLEDKKLTKKRLGRSPDAADALAISFFENVPQPKAQKDTGAGLFAGTSI